MAKRRKSTNPKIEKNIQLILAMPDKVKIVPLNHRKIFATKAISILNHFENKINNAISVSK